MIAIVMSITRKTNSVTRHPTDGQCFPMNVSVLLRAMAVAHRAVLHTYMVRLSAINAGSLALEENGYENIDRLLAALVAANTEITFYKF